MSSPGNSKSRSDATPGTDWNGKATLATLDHVLGTLLQALSADLTMFYDLRVGACRYCWGHGQEFQWKSKREFREAFAKSIEDGTSRPTLVGGFGFDPSIAPNSECPECFGTGEGVVQLRNPADWPPEAGRLISEIRQGPDGPEMRFHPMEKLLQSIKKLEVLRGTQPVDEHDGKARVIILPSKELSSVSKEPRAEDGGS